MSFSTDFDQIFDRMMRRWPLERPERAPAEPRPLRAFEHMPTVEVKESGKAYIVTVELPGLEEKDVKVEVEDDVLSISGEKYSPSRARRRSSTATTRHTIRSAAMAVSGALSLCRRMPMATPSRFALPTAC
jgi:HSP20 family molecular chaperone IbpA